MEHIIRGLDFRLGKGDPVSVLRFHFVAIGTDRQHMALIAIYISKDSVLQVIR